MTRSEIMSRIRSKNTKPELLIRGALHRSGLRFRVHRKDLPGTPDIVFVRDRIAIFVHGCFWNGHGCRGKRLPATNREYWLRQEFEQGNHDDACPLDTGYIPTWLREEAPTP